MSIRAIIFFLLIGISSARASDLRWKQAAILSSTTGHVTIASSGGALLVVHDDATLEVYEAANGSLRVGDAGKFDLSASQLIAVGGGEGMLWLPQSNPRQMLTHIIWNAASRKVEQTQLPSPPSELAGGIAALAGKTLYLADAKEPGGAWSLDLGQPSASWRVLPAWPEGGFRPQVLAAQNDGAELRLYAFGKLPSGPMRTYMLDARTDRWIRRADPLTDLTNASALATGQAHLLFVTPAGGFRYHTITNTWVAADDLRTGVGAGVLAGGSIAVVDEHGAVLLAHRPSVQSRFGWLDYLALAGYPAVLLIIGLRIRVRETDSDGYFRGGQKIPWWAAGLSLVAAQVSAIGFMAIPAKSFATDWVYFAGVSMWFVVVPIVTRFYIPLFRRLNVTTAYEYLEVRFSFAMRVFASVMFIAMQVTRAAIVLYLPALALSAVSGIDKVWCIVVMGAISTFYTLWGGMRSVIWTDVVQACMLLGGALLCVTLVLVNVGGFGAFFSTAWTDGKFNLVSARWDLASPAIWVVLIGGIFTRLAALTSDQNVVQRYQATGSNREAGRALWTDVAVSLPWAIVIFMLGTALYVFFKHNPQLLDPSMDTDQIVPLFIALRVPAGLAGLIIAAIFGASLDGGMLAVSTAFVNDVYARCRPATSPAARVAWARGVTIVLGSFATIVAVLLATSKVLSLWDQATRLTGLFAGGFAGLFILGLFARRVGTAAAFVGVLTSGVVMYFVESSSAVCVLIYAAFGVVSCVLAGILASFLIPTRREIRIVNPEETVVAPCTAV